MTGFKMRNTKLILSLLTVLLLGGLSFSVAAKAEQSFSIAAIVNEDAVSGADVYDRMKLIIASSGLRNTKEIRDEIMPQVLNSLVEEQLQMQEAARHKITITADEVAEGFETIASQNNMPSEKFRAILNHQGIPVRTLERQIESQIAWSKVVTQVIRPQIDISSRDVADRLERMRNGIGKNEYLVSEIFLPVEKSEDEPETRKLAQKLINEIQNNSAPFETVAVQFSRSPGAENGGSLGWIQDGQIAQELENSVKTLPVGGLSEPIRGLSGYHIIMLRDKRTLTEDNLPSEEEITNQIGFERLDKMQRRLLQDLKSAAFIDRRV